MKILNNCDWLLVFFIHEISEYRKHAKDLLDCIERNGLGSNNEIWVIYEKVNKQTEHKARYELVVYRLQFSEQKYVLNEVPDWNPDNSDHTRNSWEEALKFIYLNVQSRRKILFTWSHGSAFGINTESEDPKSVGTMFNPSDMPANPVIALRSNPVSFLEAEEVNQLNNLNAAFFAPGANNFFLQPVSLETGEYQIVSKEELYDCKKIEILWMSDLAEALKSCLREDQIDLLVMMNCNMQLFENGYLLKDVVKILIGPESIMWADGYAYEQLLQLISQKPKIDNETLSRSIIDDYIEMHEKLGHQNYLDNSTLFANSLREYQNIFEVLEETTSSLIKQYDEAMQTTINDLKKNNFFSVSGLGSLFLLDLGLFLETVFYYPILNPSNRQLFQNYLSLKKNSVVAEHVGAYFKDNDSKSAKKFGHSGASLFFPPDLKFSSARRISYCQYISGQLNSPFQKASSWDEFILKINKP